MKHTLNYLNKLKEQGAKRVKIENILILLESDKKRSELLYFLDWFKTKPELSEWNNDVILNLYKIDKKR